ncbi:histidine phosphatase family protein [Janibacter sp. GXQ6167]|uniref:SixA phosphatase family protein n=1 Tax=Janibacter sp. GXQ6167 TaxID=3240791 RepID=UPI003525709F
MTAASEDRTLIVLRHAETESPHPGQHDLERALTSQGEQDARAVGRWLREQEIGCDTVLCSPALRTRQTVHEIGSAGCSEAEVIIEDALYAADPSAVLQVVREAPHDASVVMVVAHAPALPAVVSMLAEGAGEAHAHDQLCKGFPPAAAALLRYSGHWSDLAVGSAVLEDYYAPSR